jgi:type IV secretion system protein VirB10
MNPFRDRKAAHPAGASVAGERSSPAVAHALSFQAKLSNLVALGLMLALAAALLLWYYTHALARPERLRHATQPGELGHAPAEMALPPLGHIEPPGPRVALMAAPASLTASNASPPSSDVASRAVPGLEMPPLVAASSASTMLASSRQSVATPTASPRVTPPSALQRRLSGDTFVAADAAGVAPVAPYALAALPRPEPLAVPATPQDAAADPTAHASTAAAGASAELPALLQDPERSAVSAARLHGLSLVLPQGSFIDCTLETAIDSSLPGMTTCVTATDTFGADGNVVLLERGTKLVGETRGQVQQGVGRVFVLWTEARTPTGVIVPLDSPGADELGRAGLPGQVERHFWERFGAAILVSVIDGAVQAGVQASTSRGGTIIYTPGGAQDVMPEILKSTVAIPPTVVKSNGDRIQVLVARDVDFSHVYELRAAPPTP